MPYRIESNGDGTVKVVNTATGEVHAAKTTRAKAEAQIRLLNAKEHGAGLPPRKKAK